MTKDDLEALVASAIGIYNGGNSFARLVLLALRDEGLAIVPTNPSKVMLATGPHINGGVHPVTEAQAYAVYRAMLSAGDLLGERGS